MFDGIVQVRLDSCPCLVGLSDNQTLQSALIFFIITYAYFTTSTRPDGYIVSQYEFSTVRPFLIMSKQSANV